MAPRNGAQFVEGLRSSPREVWVGGRLVTDVTAGTDSGITPW